MSLDTTQVADYVKENTDELLKQLLLRFDSAKHVMVRPGIKHKEKIGRIATDALLQAGGCGWNSQGVTKLDQVEIEVTPLKLNEELCQQDLDDTYFILLGKAGSIADGEDFNIEEEYVDQKVKTVQAKIEKLIWRGDTAAASLSEIDGYIKKSKAGIPDGRTGSVASVAAGTGSASAYSIVTLSAPHGLEDGVSITLSAMTVGAYDGVYEVHNVTASTFHIELVFSATATGTWTEDSDQLITRTASVKTDVESMIDLLPEEAHDVEGKKVFMSPANYRSMRREYLQIEQLAAGFTGEPGDSFMMPGEDFEIVKISGMATANDIILTYSDNLWFGTDMMNDFETTKFFYDDGEDVHKWLMKLKMGTQIAYTQHVVVAQ